MIGFWIFLIVKSKMPKLYIASIIKILAIQLQWSLLWRDQVPISTHEVIVVKLKEVIKSNSLLFTSSKVDTKSDLLKASQPQSQPQSEIEPGNNQFICLAGEAQDRWRSQQWDHGWCNWSRLLGFLHSIKYNEIVEMWFWWISYHDVFLGQNSWRACALVDHFQTALQMETALYDST